MVGLLCRKRPNDFPSPLYLGPLKLLFVNLYNIICICFNFCGVKIVPGPVVNMVPKFPTAIEIFVVFIRVWKGWNR